MSRETWTWKLSELVVGCPGAGAARGSPQIHFSQCQGTSPGTRANRGGGCPEGAEQEMPLSWRILPDLQDPSLGVWLSEFSFLEISFFHWPRTASPQSSACSLDV